ncbi:pilus (MSHA type) biogenesis protein MshL [Pseudoduganella eburnea]|uniref:Type IV pilus biogenesis and competence protein PilQ n=1 Tax=Massilia eburnea TaxID=1776165 RepID=A0A6L6QNR2_9BURK|nr:pilus (MSHA type) biogenesis protein MshL [Massilia eburnea]MTW13724.1 pilus (MSHA type) biogenesis protein MshL [Massilia eburnea]
MRNFLKLATVFSVATGLAACSMNPPRGTYDKISAEMAAVTKPPATAAAQPDAVANALLPPVSTLASALPQSRAVIEERFNVAFNNVPAQQFFNSLVAGTRYNMLVHPEVSGNITANLRDVTMAEALDAVRELYGYDYRIEGTRIYIRPLTIQTRMFQVNYLTAQRMGMSNLRVSSTSVADSNNNNNNNNNNNAGNGNNNNQQNNNNQDNGQGNNGQGGRLRDASNVMTRTESDFWKELKLSLETLVGGKEGGRSVVISPQSGVIVVRAMPEELRSVDRYLRATQLSVERQVILEAKILEVELNSGFQSGINWAAFGTGNNHRISGGVVQPGTGLAALPRNGGRDAVVDPIGNAVTGLAANSGRNIGSAAEAAGTLFGLAFQTSNFAALISFLESQGTVHVLSSPRITATNNQKAVLKIGTDEFFVTGVSTTTTTNSAGNGTVSPNVTLQPFFSGVVLDVTPQIDEHGNILMHVHPSVSQVSTVNKSVNLGSALGALNLPLASSTTSEFDSLVRGQDGKVVAIGGLMRQATTSDRSGVPGVGGLPVIGNLFSNRQEVLQKRELVVLIKPTVIEGDASWNEDLLSAERRIKDLDPAHRGAR